MKEDHIQVLKIIIFTLYEIYKSIFSYLLALVRRQTIVDLYNVCKDVKNRTEISNFIAYYKKALLINIQKGGSYMVNDYINNSNCYINLILYR